MIRAGRPPFTPDCCPACQIRTERAAQAGERRRAHVRRAITAWHTFTGSVLGALCGCIAFFTVLYAVLLLFPQGAHS